MPQSDKTRKDTPIAKVVETSPEAQTPPEPAPPPRVSVVIVSMNRAASLRRSLELLGAAHQVIVIDNGSTDGSAAVADEFPGVRTMRLPKNFGLTKALNIGLRSAEGEYILCLHDDVSLSADAVTKLADFLEARPDVGMVAPLLVDATGKPLPQIGDLPSPSHPHPAFSPVSATTETATPSASGAAFMFRSFFLRALRQIEERYGTYGPAIEMCAQMRRAAKKIVVLPSVTALHEHIVSTALQTALEADLVAGTAAFLGKHHGFASALLYRVKTGLAGLLTFRFAAVAGAFGDSKIDGA